MVPGDRSSPLWGGEFSLPMSYIMVFSSLDEFSSCKTGSSCFKSVILVCSVGPSTAVSSVATGPSVWFLI